MQRQFRYSVLILFALLMFVSCNNKPSLQGYYVANQESPNFMTADIPTNLFNLNDVELTETQEDAYKSIRRLHFLGYKVKDSSTVNFDLESAKVKTILNDEKYIDLAEFSDKGTKFLIKYIGDDEVAKELIVFGSSKEIGFGIVRVLGSDMSPEKMAMLIDAVQKSEFDGSQLNGIMDFFK